MATQIDCGQCVARRSRMVASSVGQLEWNIFQNRDKTYDSTHNRCIRPLSGRDNCGFKPQSSGVLGQRNKYTFFKCKGVISSVTYFKKFVAFIVRSLNSKIYRLSNLLDKSAKMCMNDLYGIYFKSVRGAHGNTAYFIFL